MPASPVLTRTGALLALAATAGWSMNFLFSRALADSLPPFTLCFLRCLIACILFTPFALSCIIRDWPAVKSRLSFYIFLSLAGLGLFNSLIYFAGRSTSVVNMALLATASPVFTLILSRFLLGENLNRRRIFGIAAAVGGIVLLTVRGDLSVLLGLHFNNGDLIMLAASFLFAFYNVQVRFCPPDVSKDTVIGVMFLISSAVLLPASAWEVASGASLVWTAKTIAGIMYLGAIASIFCYWCWTRAITAIGPGNASLIYYTMPLFSGVEAMLFLHEAPHWTHFAGGALIIAGVVVATWPLRHGERT